MKAGKLSGFRLWHVEMPVDHQVLIVPIPCQRLEYTLPHPVAGLTGKALVHTLVLPITARQNTPPCPRTQHPQHAIDEQPVILQRAPWVACFAWQQQLKALPLGLAKLVTAGSQMRLLGHPFILEMNVDSA